MNNALNTTTESYKNKEYFGPLNDEIEIVEKKSFAMMTKDDEVKNANPEYIYINIRPLGALQATVVEESKDT